MVKAPPQAPVADASAPPPVLHDGAGQKPAGQRQGGKVVSQQRPTTAAHEITRRDVHTASSINAQRRLAKTGAREQSPVYQPAIRREEACQTTSPKSPTTPISGPVVVRGPSAKPAMKKKPHPMDKSTSPQFPPIESFSFQDILDSIGPEANAAIDAIAEICGRSKMSLAAEHSSHRQPLAQLTTTESSPDTLFLPARLEPVAETSSSRPHTRSMSRNLALATGAAHNGEGLPGDPTAATSNVTSHTHTSSSGHEKGDGASTTMSASLLPQVLAWLRRSGSSITSEPTSASGQDAGAISAMHKLLNDRCEA